jgi:hypothetical protein
MSANIGRRHLAVALLGLSLIAALAIGFRAQSGGVTLQAHTAGMQLQGMADADDNSAAPEGNKVGRVQRDQDSQTDKQELVVALSHDRLPQDSMARGAPLDQQPLKARN